MAIKKPRRHSARKRAPGSIYKPINPGQIRKWERDYISGVMSKRVLSNVIKRLGDERAKANRRMKRFADRKKSSKAQKRALGKIEQRFGRGRNTWGKAANTDQLFATALEINAFLSDETSTLTGVAAYNKKRRETFRKRFPNAAKMPDDRLDDFLRLLHDESVADYFDFFANYDEEIEQMAAIMEQASGEEWLHEQFDLFAEYQEAAKEGSTSTDVGLSARELRDSLRRKYSDKRGRKRR